VGVVGGGGGVGVAIKREENQPLGPEEGDQVQWGVHSPHSARIARKKNLGARNQEKSKKKKNTPQNHPKRF